jgi:uncharacterized membrane protein YdfJ with MMPL/SSD domain
MFIKKILSIAMSLLLTSVMAIAAEPTIHEVYEAFHSGNQTEAHEMINKVLNAHPNSAKAHFVDAEILAREGKIAEAKEELATAQRLAPGLPFAKPSSVSAITQALSQNDNNKLINSIGSNYEKQKKEHFPWMLLMVVVAAIVIVIMIVKSFFTNNSQNRNYDSSPQPYRNSNYPQGFQNNGPVGQPNYVNQPYPQQNTGMGGGIMSGLATGAAVGVGVVAGEALAHHFMDDSNSDHKSQNNNSNDDDLNKNRNNIQDDNDFGMSDTSSWDDSSSDMGSDDSSW